MHYESTASGAKADVSDFQKIVLIFAGTALNLAADVSVIARVPRPPPIINHILGQPSSIRQNHHHHDKSIMKS